MSLASVREHLSRFGRANDVIEFAVSSATVDLAAKAIGVEPERIAKTLSIVDGADAESAVLVVTAGDARLISGEFKRRFGYKPRFVGADDVERLTGHPVGGVCPFANPEGTQVWLDASLRRFEVVYPAAGSPNSAIGITPEELAEVSGAVGWVEVTRLPGEEG